MDLMEGIQVASVFANAIREVWAHPMLAGVLDSFGGPGVLDEGLQELQIGSYQVVADLLAARSLEVDLADAVFDPDNFPHLARLHGRIFDFMTLRVPEVWTPIIKTIFQLRLPDDGRTFRCMVAHIAFRSMHVGESALAQFMLFEVLCIHQRLALMRQNEALESIGGRRRDIEVLAQQEIEIPVSVDVYKDELLSTDDPVVSLMKIATTSLLNHIDVLDQEIKAMRNLPRDLEAVRTIQEHVKHLEPDEALLFRNKTASLFGEQQMSPDQLQVLHPIHLRLHSPDNIYQKTHRAFEKVKKMSQEMEAGETKRALPSNQLKSISDIILEIEREQS